MEMPLIDRCFGMFPPKYACYLISLFGLGTGGVGLTGIILYGIVEEVVLKHFSKLGDADTDIKKLVLMTVGLSSLLLVIANLLLFLGVTSSSRGSVSTSKWMIFLMNMLIVTELISMPVLCFFDKNSCLVKKVSPIAAIFAYLILGGFLEIWLYFMVVIYNFELEL